MVSCCFQLLKLVGVVLILVSFGIGYTRFYQLFIDVSDAFQQASVGSDPIWIPYLTVQVMTTVFLVVKLFCLLRELCEDNYMYNHCFKLTFTLTVLIYLLSVFPKTIISIVNKKRDLTLDQWWDMVVSFFDGLVNSVENFIFQIILFMVVIKKAFRSAGVCRGQRVAALDSSGDSSENIEPKTCCLFACCNHSSRLNNSCSKTETGTENKGAIKTVDEISNPPGQKSRLRRGMDKAASAYAKPDTLSKRIDQKTQDMRNKVNDKIKKKEQEVKMKIVEQSRKAKGNIEKNARFASESSPPKGESRERHGDAALDNIVCKFCGQNNPLAISMEKTTNGSGKLIKTNASKDLGADNSSSDIGISNESSNGAGFDMNKKEHDHTCKENHPVCVYCGNAVETTTCSEDSDSAKDSGSNCCSSHCCSKCGISGALGKVRDAVCRIYERRTLCFIITMSLANIHFLLYLVDLVFIFCVLC